MASTSNIRSRSLSYRLTSVLSYAALEWLLMLLLFLNAAFSYLLTKFARFCKLQTPCLLCSRLDHIFGHEKPEFSSDLICESHKSEISLLSYCDVHQKLANAHEMCEGCLIPFATWKQSNTEMYKIGKEYDDSIVPLLKKDPDSDYSATSHCSCCSIPLRNKLDAVGSLKNNRTEVGLNKILEESLGSTQIHHSKNHRIDHLSYTGYTEVKVTSDSDSEVPASYDDGRIIASHEVENLEEDVTDRCLQPDPATSVPNKLSASLGSTQIHNLKNRGIDHLSRTGYTEVKVTSDSDSEVLALYDDGGILVSHEVENLEEDVTDRCLQPDPATSVPNKLSASLGLTQIHNSKNRGIDHLSRTGYTEVKVTSDSDSEVPSSYDDGGIVASHEVEDLKEDVMGRCLQPDPATSVPDELSATLSDDTIHTTITVDSSFPMPEKQLVHIVMSHDVSSMASTVAIEHGLEEINSNKIDARNNHTTPCETVSETVLPDVPNAEILSENRETPSEQASKNLSSTEVSSKINQPTNGPRLSVPTHMDLNDAYRLATGNKSNLASPVSDVITGRDSFRVYEDLKILISQMSAARGVETPWNDLSPSPRVQWQGDDASSSAVLENITKRISIDRNESGLESLDGSITSEIEGESVVDRLKRQLELDRKSLYLLYKELEEERGASTIAANQAMAMITRLQEEKAAMQMEALQYQRMMEEQAEYDQEALQKSNELLAEREKDIQDLEADIESYRKQFGDESLGNKFQFSTKFEQAESANLNDPLLGFDDEKDYISDRLKKLEEDLLRFSSNVGYANVEQLDMQTEGHLNKPCEDDNRESNQQTNGQHPEVETMGHDLEQHRHEIMLHSHMEDRVLSEDFSIFREDPNTKTCSNFSNIAALQDEVSQLNERLKALEADRNFLERTMNSLRNGDSGIQFIQEIACDLRELRRIVISRREHGVA